MLGLRSLVPLSHTSCVTSVPFFCLFKFVTKLRGMRGQPQCNAALVALMAEQFFQIAVTTVLGPFCGRRSELIVRCVREHVGPGQ